jgi:hypothetical protein
VKFIPAYINLHAFITSAPHDVGSSSLGHSTSGNGHPRPTVQKARRALLGNQTPSFMFIAKSLFVPLCIIFSAASSAMSLKLCRIQIILDTLQRPPDPRNKNVLAFCALNAKKAIEKLKDITNDLLNLFFVYFGNLTSWMPQVRTPEAFFSSPCLNQ